MYSTTVVALTDIRARISNSDNQQVGTYCPFRVIKGDGDGLDSEQIGRSESDKLDCLNNLDIFLLGKMLTREHKEKVEANSWDKRIQRNLIGRSKPGISLVEQACCDREIQRYLCKMETQSYKFNCYIVHQAHRFIYVIKQIYNHFHRALHRILNLL